MFGIHFLKDLSHIFTLFFAGLFFLTSQLVQFFCIDEIFIIVQVNPIFTCQQSSATFCEVLVTVVSPTASSFKNNFIYVCLDVLGLCCCVGFFLVGASGDYSLLWCIGFSLLWLLVSQQGLQGAQASVAAACGLGSSGSQGLEHRLNQLWCTCLVAPRHGTFPDQASNPCILHWLRWLKMDSLPLSHH